ncbi:ShlB/FhaC/HecB family hemolysin secretion/activation protein [Parasphingopyxis marina]|uniref:ShlB/FhaC/HecB family hemolysin secretion/activation protein n=1 Tax=Parasphingopyxis marina TaxID=2761622 RepID=A0A842HY54_9SPHN|nr:ShlB/FhaC/HecB family hemolysin secretion/activation protein [Parasphingopyxis marina]MBC2778036.1 ShlB/FhaC/HecB family hemolysin secretion/activation protein [Parasphingopyxis marina]
MALRNLGLISGFVLAAWPAAAIAQTTAAPTREEILRQPDTSIGERPERIEVEGGIERAPCPLAQPRFENVRFTLRGATFSNLGEISESDLAPSFAEYLGQEVPIATVCDIRDGAATILRNQGYLAAVQVPPQQIGDDGIVRFDILTAQMTRIQVRGETGNSENRIAGYLEPLTHAGPFNQRAAERNLLLARELPGFDTRLTLRPADGAPGEVIGDVRVERTGFVGELNVQNYSSHSTGRFGGQARAQFNDLTGMGDSTNIAFFASADFNEQLVVSLAHSFAAGNDGMRVGGSFTYAWNDPTIAGASPFDTETMIASAFVSYPFVLDQGTRIGGTAGFDFINQQIEFGGAPLNRDRLRVAYARLDAQVIDRASIDGHGGFSAAEPRWRFAGSAEIRQGLDIFDATDPGIFPAVAIPQTRTAGKAGATVIRFEGLAEFRPSPVIAFVLQPRAQISWDPLLSYEEFSAGNYTVGRGYDPGTIIGDQGFGFRSEIRFSSAVPRTRESWALQPYGFFDAVWVWNDDPVFSGFGGSDELWSAGAGLRANYGDLARFDATFTVPIERTNITRTRPDPRLLISMLIRFAR